MSNSVSKRDYAVDLHTHTVASTHAFSTVNELARQGAAIGMDMIAITDHGPKLVDGASPWHFVNMRILPRVIDGVFILRGIEANIMTGGDLDCEDRILSMLDFVMAGFHEPLQTSMGIAGNTDAMVKAMASGKIHAVSHPGNPLFPIDVHAVVEAAVKHNVALEVNNSSFKVSRKGSWEPCLELIRAHGAAGGKITLGSDSHHTSALGKFDMALSLVDQAGFPRENIVNKDVPSTLNFLSEHGIRLDDFN